MLAEAVASNPCSIQQYKIIAKARVKGKGESSMNRPPQALDSRGSTDLKVGRKPVNPS